MKAFLMLKYLLIIILKHVPIHLRQNNSLFEQNQFVYKMLNILAHDKHFIKQFYCHYWIYLVNQMLFFHREKEVVT